MVSMPIEDSLPALRQSLASSPAVLLSAPPGAGKTTLVPLALRHEPWLGNRRIIILEPRRLAARNAARYMARLLDEDVGQTVGYRVRHDTRISSCTRIEVITEGILTRMLQNDPALEGVGLLIFDEFHERSLHSDLGMALARQSQAILRPDLKLLVMSATLAVEQLSSLLDAPVVVCHGRQYPVQVQYRSEPVAGRIEEAVVGAVLTAWHRHNGGILVFLPGAGEIGRVQRRLREENLTATDIVPLLGSMPLAVQDKALTPDLPGWRKIVLATSVAETSLTVEGIETVIDSGLMRQSRFSPRTGMSRLETVTVSRAASDQRCGRAGRLSPGYCYRLWSEAENRGLVKHSQPEILRADLASLALELALWGVKDYRELTWLDCPPAAAMEQAHALLVQLGALSASGNVTSHGRRLAAGGIHPRLAHMIITSQSLGLGRLACELAALLGERAGLSVGEIDMRTILDAVRRSDKMLDPALLQKVRTETAYLAKVFQVSEDGYADNDACGLLLALAYPDRIGQRRGDGRFLLVNGRGAVLPGANPLSQAAYLVAADLDDAGSDGRIWLAAPLSQADIEQYLPGINDKRDVFWDNQAQAVRARQRRWLGAVLLRDETIPPTREECQQTQLEAIALGGLSMLPWTSAAVKLRQRLLFVHRHEPDKWPDLRAETLLATLPAWLGPYLYDSGSAADWQTLPLAAVLTNMLDWSQQRRLEEAAPAQMAVPSGRSIAIDYSEPSAPVLAVRIQELFGMTDTPRLLDGKVPLTIHLLSPANRPVQVTQDLASFWRSAYFAVRKELAGRYPKHYWPEDPLQAAATSRTRPR